MAVPTLMTGSASTLDRPVALAESHCGAPDLKPLDSPMACGRKSIRR